MFSEELEKIDWEETTKTIYSKTESDVLRALGKEHCDVDDFMALISPAADFEAAEATIAGLEQKILSTAEGGAIKAILYHYQTEAARLADESAQRIVELADSPDTPEFRQAVQDNRNGKKRMEDSKALIQRVLDIMA